MGVSTLMTQISNNDIEIVGSISYDYETDRRPTRRTSLCKPHAASSRSSLSTQLAPLDKGSFQPTVLPPIFLSQTQHRLILRSRSVSSPRLMPAVSSIRRMTRHLHFDFRPNFRSKERDKHRKTSELRNFSVVRPSLADCSRRRLCYRMFFTSGDVLARRHLNTTPAD